MNTIMNNRLREETKQLYETTGLTLQEIADEYNLDIGVINKWRKNYKWNKPKEYIAQRNSNYKYTEEFRNRVKHDWETTDYTNEDIAKKFGITANLVFRWSRDFKWVRLPHISKIRRKNNEGI